MSWNIRLWVAFGAFIIMLCLQGLTGLYWQTSLAIAILFIVTDVILEKMEKDNATKRALRRVGNYLLVFICYLGLRTILGYLLNAPMINADDDLIKIGAKLVWYKDLSAAGNLVLEIAFILPALGVAYGLVNGGKPAKGLIYLVSFILLLAVFWQVKQQTHTAAMKRNWQGSVDINARHQNNRALAKESAAASSYGVAKTSITRFYRLDMETNSIAKNKLDHELPQGSVVLQVKPGEKPHTAHGQAFTPVILPNKDDGSFIGGEWVWVESTQFDWVDGGNVLPGKKFVVDSKKTTKIVFDTNNKVVVLENWQAGQKIKISGYGDDDIFFRDGSRLAKIPASGVITSAVNQPLEITYKKGGVIYINS